MKKFIMTAIIYVTGFSAHAGFQFGVVCKDVSGEKYLFSESVQGNNVFTNETECLTQKCQSSILSIRGVTTDSGIIFSGKLFSSAQVTDEDLSKQTGGYVLSLKEVRGKALLCSERTLLKNLNVGY